MNQPLPIWIRLPKVVKDSEGKALPARCPYTGISRGKLFELVAPCRQNKFRPLIKSVLLPEGEALSADGEAKSKRKVRGRRHVRLISLSSLLEFLDKEAERQAVEREAKLAEGREPGGVEDEA